MTDALAKAISGLEASIARNTEWLVANPVNSEVVIAISATDTSGMVLVSHDHGTGRFEFSMGGAGERATGLTNHVASSLITPTREQWKDATIVPRRDFVERHNAQMKKLLEQFKKSL
ncbi:hypothetical protein EVC12_040 [Rhizobium phage RHph_I42]|nr:hypothetical protein EVC12_040 [Rhizobium phage RHph_I42]